MSNQANSLAVQHLINIEKNINRGTDSHRAVLAALGEAGGIEAIQHLIQVEQTINRGTDSHRAVLNALGRAGRIVE